MYAGSLLGPGRQLGPSRRALLETRRLTDYLPHTVSWVAWLLAAYGVGALLSTFPVGVVVVGVCHSNTDLWVPQRYTTIGSAGVAAGLALAAVVLRRLISRPRPDERDVAEDDRYRREATASVIAACGVLVAARWPGASACSARSCTRTAPPASAASTSCWPRARWPPARSR